MINSGDDGTVKVLNALYQKYGYKRLGRNNGTKLLVVKIRDNMRMPDLQNHNYNQSPKEIFGWYNPKPKV